MIRKNLESIITQQRELLTDVSFGLFFDSIKCFDAGIYRQAYLLAYQGLIQHLRVLLLQATKPSGYDEGKWRGVQSNLNNDKEFDDQVFRCIQTKNQPNANPPIIAVLDIPDSVRDDFTFWRNRRNDCAHYKEYEINQSHVLAFYSLLNQYLFKISVEGGMRTLLREFTEMLDNKRHSRKESLQPLIDKILLMVQNDEMNDFFKNLSTVFGFLEEDRYYSLLNDILSGTNVPLKQYLIVYLRQDDTECVRFLSSCPQQVGQLISKETVREFWHKLHNRRERFSIVANMLNCSMINPLEIEECITYCIDSSYNNNDYYMIGEEEAEVLIRNGIIDILKNGKCKPSHTSMNAAECGKRHYDFFRTIVASFPINDVFIEMMVGIFSQVSYPTVWAAIFQQNIYDNPKRSKEFEDICSKNSWSIPSCIQRPQE